MRTAVIIGGVMAVGIVAGVLLLRSRVAESGTLAGLPQRLARLKQQDNDPKAFLGFCTCDEDALYFVHEGGTFYLDYELTTPAKKARAANFRSVAGGLDLPVIDTSYSGEYPVLRVNVGTSEAQAAKIGMEFSNRLFGHNPNTVYEFLP
ncbi:MAG TPA: hypothetical protein VL527_02380 [Dongiaceae bacterium]|jgi:hypothetical protein|nr:hypothetical protein [Dongiaceae bacterium]